MKSLNLKEMEVVEGGRFLGWGWKQYDKDIVEHDSRCPNNGASFTYSEVYTVFGLEMPSLGLHTGEFQCM